MQIAINGWFVNEWTTGSGQYLHGLLTALTAQATDAVTFSLLLPFPKRARGMTQLHAQWPAVTIMSVRIPPLGAQLSKLWWEQVAVPLATAKLGADLLWVPYWAAPLWQPCPVVVTVHDVVQYLLPAYRGGPLQQWYTQLVSHTARRSAAILTVSHGAAQDIVEQLQVPPTQVAVVYNGLAPLSPAAQSASAVDAVRHKYRLPARFFLYLGGFDMRKNLHTIIAAYGRYLEKGGDPAVRLVIAGKLPNHDSAFAPDPQKIAAEAGLLAQIHFCGYVDETDKATLYRLATAYLFPSLYEGFGFMALEAMQAGAPVITSDR